MKCYGPQKNPPRPTKSLGHGRTDRRYLQLQSDLRLFARTLAVHVAGQYLHADTARTVVKEGVLRDLRSGQRIHRKDEFLDRLAADEVLLQDAFEDLGSSRVIPNAVGIDHGDGSVLADAQAVCLSPIDAALGP